MAIVAKTCTKCGQMKRLSEYHKAPSQRTACAQNVASAVASTPPRGGRTHPDYNKQWRHANPERARELQARKRQGSSPRCTPVGRCMRSLGTTENLSLDHVNGDGARHRKELGCRENGLAVYRWLVRNDYPQEPPIQLLCKPCNSSKNRGDRCYLVHLDKMLRELRQAVGMAA